MTRWGPFAVVLGLFVHVGLGVILVTSDLPPRTLLGIDFDVAYAVQSLRTDGGIRVMRVLTDIGYGPAASVATLLGVIYAVRHQRVDNAIALTVGLLLLFAAVNVTKDLWGRARPLDMLAPAGGLSYPSGHAAYATAWVAAAIVTGKRPLIVAACAIVIFVGFSRLYLGVHFFTDVLGGVALGAVVYGLVLRR